MTSAIARFAADVGGPEAGAVAVEGRRSQWSVGGSLAEGTRLATAPDGVVAHQPAELTVRVGAGTLVSDLNEALAEAGQQCPIEVGSTVGGALAVGRTGRCRLGRGPLRDVVLEVTMVGADGRVVRAGGPTVKNVSGYDLVRLLVGSLGTLGCLAEVVLRCRPRPEATVWLAGEADPAGVRAALFAPTAVLWDGATTWIGLEGQADDVRAETAVATRHGLVEVDGPPDPQHRHRWSVPAAALRASVGGLEPGTFLAQVGVGIVEAAAPPPRHPVDPAVADLHARLKALYDPTGRLNPGRSVLPA